MMDSKDSQRHHFVPQFYLREWYAPGCGYFYLYKLNPRKQLDCRSRPSKAVGFEPDLYTISPDGLHFQPTKSQQLEHDFFALIDDSASVVHRKILNSGIQSLTEHDRNCLSKFISSLLERSPSRIRQISELAATGIEETLASLESERPEMMARPAFSAVLSAIDKQALARNLALEKITSAINDHHFIHGISAMKWMVITIPSGDDHFLTGDTPLVVNGGGIKEPIYLISLAISPKSLLIIYKDEPEFDDDFLKTVSILHNAVLTNQTQSHLVSSRTLEDGRFMKYRKMAETMLDKDQSILDSLLKVVPESVLRKIRKPRSRSI
jgi:hypothetical protein